MYKKMMITILIILFIAFAAMFFVNVIKAQSNNSYQIQNNQSRIDGLKADQKTYNTNPSARPNDGYNSWLNSQTERATKDRDAAIQRELRDNRNKGK